MWRALIEMSAETAMAESERDALVHAVARLLSNWNLKPDSDMEGKCRHDSCEKNTLSNCLWRN